MKNRLKKISASLGFLAILPFLLLILMVRHPTMPVSSPCTAEWYNQVEENFLDACDGHGPDQGDSEWFGAIEKGLGLQETKFDSNEARCKRIDFALRNNVYTRFRGTRILIKL